MSVTLTHDTSPEQAEAAIYAALAASPGDVELRVHGFPREALDVIVSRLPAGTGAQVNTAGTRVKITQGNTVKHVDVGGVLERFASFNVLGSHHTDAGGKNAGLASGPWRMNQAVKLWNDQGVSVATLEEFETPQRNAILSHRRWGVFSATPNNRFRNGDTMGNAIAYRKDIWELVDSYSIPVPITGRQLHMAVVILRHRKTGLYVAVMAVHNPSTGPISGGSQADRENAKRIENTYANKLRAMGLPVVLGGDFNERDVAGDFTGEDTAVQGGVDHLMTWGTEEKRGKVTTAGVKGRLSDHPLVTAFIGLFKRAQPTTDHPRLPRGIG